MTLLELLSEFCDRRGLDRPTAVMASTDPTIRQMMGPQPALPLDDELPAIYEETAYAWREYCEAGGLMSYGANQRATYVRLATYADRLLRGERPGDLPIEQPTKFEFVINLKTARALGLTIPPLAAIYLVPES